MKAGALVVLAFLVLGLSATPSEAGDRQHKLWKSPSSSQKGKSICSSVVLPLYGNVYPQGCYHAVIDIGHPPRSYFVDPDTGSDLTWLRCEPDGSCAHCTKAHRPCYRSNNILVPREDPLCASLPLGKHIRDVPSQCDYEVEYADGGSSLGFLVNDVTLLNLTNGVRITPRLAIGCGYDNRFPDPSSQPLDGVLGLGKGKTGIVSQLHSQGQIRNVVGHCFSSHGGGFLFFGNDVYDSSRVVSTPMSHDREHYSPGFGEVIYDGKATGLNDLHVKKELRGKPLRQAVDDETLPFCWKGRNPFISIEDVRDYFKPLALSFSSGSKSKTQFEIPLEGYLLISSKGSVCLGVLNGTKEGLQNFNIIGDISMQDKMVIYDNEKQTIGWTPANCDRPPVSNTMSM